MNPKSCVVVISALLCSCSVHHLQANLPRISKGLAEFFSWSYIAREQEGELCIL
jgi:hypothetical protein